MSLFFTIFEMSTKVFVIQGAIKTYDWGKIGLESSVASLHQSAHADFHVVHDCPYAELWMGTHPSGQSLIPSLDNITLSEWLIEHPESLGSSITDQYNQNGLPFLFKVLSIRKALSIQIHPDKPTAEKLHEQFSDRYPDDNHKPELAIALTNFQALCGFRPITEVKSFISELPQLKTLIGNDLASRFLENNENVELFKDVFTSLITSEDHAYKPILKDIADELNTNCSLSDLSKSVKQVFLTLNKEYPGDVGCLCIFFLNCLELNPGQAIFLAANEPHAYLKGDCIECMACSDNVVRAGLTPKFKDVETLCKLLTYQCKSAEDNLFCSVVDKLDPCVEIYNPPVMEFVVAKIEITKLICPYKLAVLSSASILIVIHGEGVAISTEQSESKTLNFSYGTVIFISCTSDVQFNITSPKAVMFRAFCD